jgi:hypothetical protein
MPKQYRWKLRETEDICLYKLLQAGWPEEKPELPWGPNAGIFYILLGVGLLLLALIRKFKK